MQDTNILVIQEAGKIEFNFEELKNQLSSEMNRYKGMIFTDDTKKEAKGTVASLRKLKKAVSDKRIEVKKAYMAPYTDFEAKVKELDKLIDEPIALINTQIDDFERKRVEERKKLIGQIYKENINGLEEYLTLPRIYQSKWENATTSKKSIADEITSRAEEAKKDIETLKAMSSDAVDAALGVYKTTLNLADAISYINRYETQKAEILKREEEKKVERKEPVKKEPIKEEPVKKQERIPETGFATYRIKADPFQIAQLESAMREYGIEFERI